MNKQFETATGEDDFARGVAEGRTFDRELRADEIADRSRRLVALRANRTPEGDGGSVRGGYASLPPHVQRQYAELSRFHGAVVESFGWKLLELFRSLVGRGWSSVVAKRGFGSTGTVYDELRELQEFRSALLRSRSWKILQRVRGWFGRQW